MMYVNPCNEPIIIEASQEEHTISRKRPRSQLNRTTSASAPQSKKRRGVVKVVNFVNYVEYLPEISSSNTDNWHNNEDSKRFNSDVKQDVLYLAKLCNEKRLREFDVSMHTSIGIEKYCCKPATRDQRQAANNQHIKAVLRLQEAQRKLGVLDEEAIRQVAMQYSKSAVQNAASQAACLWKRP